MKIDFAVYFLLMFTLVLVSSCSIEKRRYTDGFHVEWRHFSKGHSTQDSTMARYAESGQQHQSPDTNTTVNSLQRVDSISITSVQEAQSSPTAARRKASKTSEPVKEDHLAASTSFRTKSMGSIMSGSMTEVSGIGKIFSLIGFGIALLAIASFIIALSVAEGWAGLGYIGLAFVLAVAAFVFAALAQVFIKRNGERTPWYQWVGLIIGFIGLGFLIGVLFT